MFTQHSMTLLFIEVISILTFMNILLCKITYTTDNEHMGNILTHTNQSSIHVKPNQINDHQLMNPPYDITSNSIRKERNNLNEDENVKFSNSINSNYSYIQSSHTQEDLNNIIYSESRYMPLSKRFFTTSDTNNTRTRNPENVSYQDKKFMDADIDGIISDAEQQEALSKKTLDGTFKNIQTILERTV